MVGWLGRSVGGVGVGQGLLGPRGGWGNGGVGGWVGNMGGCVGG